MLLPMATRGDQIAADLRRRLDEREWSPGDRMPTYEDLATRSGARSASIQAALAILRRERLIRVTRRRVIIVGGQQPRRQVERGALVRRDPRRGYIMPAAARADEPGQTHGRPCVSAEPIPARPAELLGVDQGTPVVRRRRVTSPAGEPPFQLADTWIHP